jgi:hypothetical protein
MDLGSVFLVAGQADVLASEVLDSTACPAAGFLAFWFEACAARGLAVLLGCAIEPGHFAGLLVKSDV